MQNLQVNKKEIALKSLFGMIIIWLIPIFFYKIFTQFTMSFITKNIENLPKHFGLFFDDNIVIFFKLSPIILGFYYLLSYMILYFAWKKDKKIYDFVFEMMIACMLYLFAQSFFILILSKLKFAYNISYALSNQISSIANLCFVLLFFYTWFKISQMEIKNENL